MVLQHFLSSMLKMTFCNIHLDDPACTLQPLPLTRADTATYAWNFDLRMSYDIFQMQMDQLTDRLPSILTIHDICVFDHSPNECKNLQPFMPG